MIAKSRILSILIILIVLVTSCSQDDDGIYLNEIREPAISYTEMESEILGLVNEYRARIGVNRLNVMNTVSYEAKPHTDYMLSKGEASHDNFELRLSNLRTNANATKVSENVAYGYTTAQSVVNAWLRSSLHKEVIENPEFTDFGISIRANTDGKNYFTHIFIKR